jgi:superoxide dismutase, Cu-Zn family
LTNFKLYRKLRGDLLNKWNQNNLNIINKSDINFQTKLVLTMKQLFLSVFVFAAIMASISSCTPPKGSEEGESDTTAVQGEKMETMGDTEEMEESPTAIAQMEAKSGSNVSGTVTFTMEDAQVHIMVDLQGLTPGKHAIHIHEFGDCSAPDGTSAGGHWNPSSEAHGHISETEEFHYGDIGNLEVGEDSTATFERTVDIWTIGGEGVSNIVGQSVIVHAGEDDFTTQPTGAAGGRIACGVIEMQ